MILAVQALDRRQGFVVIRHFDETEPAAPAGLAVAQHLRRAHGAVLLEQFLEDFRCYRVLEISNVKPLRHRTRPNRLSTDTRQ